MYKIDIRTKDNGSTKGLLKKGLVPGVIYGKGAEATSVFFNENILIKLMDTGSFYTKILEIEINGSKEKVLPKVLQYHPVTDKLIHFDFLRVQDNTKVIVEIPIEFLNQDTCPGLKKGGVLNLVRRLVEITCNANKIPKKLTYDLIESEIGDSVKISNIELPDGVSPTITDRDFVIATLVPPTVEVETKTEEEATEGEEATDGEAKLEGKDESKEEVKTEDKKDGTSEDKSK